MTTYESQSFKEEDDIGAKISSLRKTAENGREREDGKAFVFLINLSENFDCVPAILKYVKLSRYLFMFCVYS